MSHFVIITRVDDDLRNFHPPQLVGPFESKKEADDLAPGAGRPADAATAVDAAYATHARAAEAARQHDADQASDQEVLTTNSVRGG